MSKKKKQIDLSPYENREALCPHFGKCGGCAYQKISYDRQLQMKADLVRRLLEETCRGRMSDAGGVSASCSFCDTSTSDDVCDTSTSDDVCDTSTSDDVCDASTSDDVCDTSTFGQGFVFEGILPSPMEEGYRNKMEFTFGDECKDGPFALGLHQKGSFMNIVNVTDCHLIHPDLNLVRNTVRDYFQPFYEAGNIGVPEDANQDAACYEPDAYEGGRVTFYNHRTHRGWLRHLLLRRAAATGEILVALVTTSQLDFDAATINADAVHTNKRVLRPSDASPLDVDEQRRMLGELTERLLALELEGSITGILHITNDSLADTIRSDKTDILFGRDYIIDEVLGLRFRISVFSFFQTNTKGAEVLYEKAREYASSAHGVLYDLYSGTGTITQLMANAVEEAVGVEIVEEAVCAARENAALNGISNVRFIAADVLAALDDLPKPDSLILDPPREGIHPKALGKILHYGVDHVVYVSCKPTSLARDLRGFFAAGYTLEKVCCVDMFPETEHVEVVAKLSKLTGTVLRSDA